MATGIWEIVGEYTVKLAKRRGSGFDEFLVYERFEVPVEALPAKEAAVRLGGGQRCDIEWREHAGETWRTFEGTTNVAFQGIVTADLYRQMMDRFCDPDIHKRPSSGWQDLVFPAFWETRGSLWLSRKAIPRSQVPLAQGRTVLEDGREEAWAKAMGKAANVVLFDGVPHRKAPLPVWNVTHKSQGSIWYEPVMPETIHSPGATFPHDRLDDALVFAHRLAEAVGGVVQREGKAVVEHSIEGRPLPAVHEAANAFKGIQWALGSDRVRDLPLECLAAIGEGARGVLHLRKGRIEEGLAALEAAIEAFAEDRSEVDVGECGSRLAIAASYARTHLAHGRFLTEIDDQDRFALEGI